MATTAEITSLYKKYLNREPDAEGLAYWSQFPGDINSLEVPFREAASSEIGKAVNPILNNPNYTNERKATLLRDLGYSPEAISLGTGQSIDELNKTYNLGFSGGQGGGSNGLSDLYDNLNTGLRTSKNPYIQAAQETARGNLQSAQAATAANRVNQYTPYGSLQYQQTGTDAQGNPIWSATQSLAPEFQGTLSNLASQVGQTSSQAFNPTNLPSYGINPGESYEQAIMRRLQPQQERQSKQLEAQLANQGIMPGSEAYANAKTQLAQQQNDQLTSAVVGGFNTGLAANQQQFAQEAAKYQMPLSQLNAFRSATAPNYVQPYQQAATSGPDYLTAYTNEQAARVAASNANQASKSATTSGLLGLAGTLGGAAILSGW